MQHLLRHKKEEIFSSFQRVLEVDCLTVKSMDIFKYLQRSTAQWFNGAGKQFSQHSYSYNWELVPMVLVQQMTKIQTKLPASK